MKKILLILWCIVIALIGTFIIIRLSDRNKEIKIFPSVNSEIFTSNRFDSLCMISDKVLLIVGANQCDLCDYIYHIVDDFDYSFGKYFIKKEYHKNNELVAQALHTVGYPTCHLVDKEGNIIGILGNNRLLDELMEAAFIRGEKICTLEFDSISSQNVLPMINYGFRGLISLLENDYESMRTNAELSLGYGEYFFNIYLMYLYYAVIGDEQKTLLFKEKCTEHAYGVNLSIYKTLIEEIVPGKIEIKCKHTHGL